MVECCEQRVLTQWRQLELEGRQFVFIYFESRWPQLELLERVVLYSLFLRLALAVDAYTFLWRLWPKTL